MSRFARHGRVWFIEEPILEEGSAYIQVSRRGEGLFVATPHIPKGTEEKERSALQRRLVDALLQEHRAADFTLWYYTPMALEFTRHLPAQAIVYDCMDELSAFAGAPRPLRDLEKELFARADLVFTGGQSLYEAKRDRHPSVHAFPSSVEAAHFARARSPLADPVDQARIPHPRLGFFGVIDERMDLELIREIAEAKPDWHLVLLGPVAKVNPANLPRRANIHYLGPKAYTALPDYLAGWDVALLPFARNESTRFISPTKTPEYLAGGRRVVSTPIRDVVHPYGDTGLVRIAETAPDFVAAIAASLNEGQSDADFVSRVDAFLAETSWDKTWEQMNELIRNIVRERSALPTAMGVRTQSQVMAASMAE